MNRYSFEILTSTRNPRITDDFIQKIKKALKEDFGNENFTFEVDDDGIEINTEKAS